MFSPTAWTFAAALTFATVGAGFAQTTQGGPAAGAPGASSTSGADGNQTTVPHAAPAAPTTMGQVPHPNAAPPPVSRNRNDCNKTNCVDNGGG